MILLKVFVVFCCVIMTVQGFNGTLTPLQGGLGWGALLLTEIIEILRIHQERKIKKTINEREDDSAE